MGYPGGKNGSGVYQWIINQIPPHNLYVEAFVGGGSILRLKKPARLSIAIDIDAEAIARHRHEPPVPGLWALNTDAIGWLDEHGNELEPSTFVYLDPPYLMETRRSQRKIYRHEMSDDDHRRLLTVITRLRCMVAISGYRSEMYDQALAGWRVSTFETVTHGGRPATEVLWANYPPPVALHDYRYLGSGFREREKIARQKRRWLARLARMPETQRYAMLAAIDEYKGQ